MIFYFLIIVASIIALFTLKAAYNVYHYNFKHRYFRPYAQIDHKNVEFSLTDENPTFYYADFEPGIRDFTFNDKGEIVAKFGVDEVDFHPCMIAEYTIICAEHYLKTGDEKYKQSFRVQAEWLVNHIQKLDSDPNAGLWYYCFDNSEIKAKFYSGISQGIGISALVRAYVILKDKRYLDTALMAYNAMIRPFSDYGCTFEHGDWKGWIEEDTEGYHILNGHIYSLIGLYDLWRSVRSEEIRKQYELALEILKRKLPSFDKKYFSLYSQRPGTYCNNSYQLIHVCQMNMLYRITGDSLFFDYSKRFQLQYDSTLKRIHFFIILFIEAIKRKITK